MITLDQILTQIVRDALGVHEQRDRLLTRLHRHGSSRAAHHGDHLPHVLRRLGQLAEPQLLVLLDEDGERFIPPQHHVLRRARAQPHHGAAPLSERLDGVVDPQGEAEESGVGEQRAPFQDPGPAGADCFCLFGG